MTTLADGVGRRVTFPVPARRVVSLAPSVTECLFAIGAGRTLVGVSSADDWPAAAKFLRAGSFYQPSVERIRALRPDVVLLESATIDRASADAFAARVNRPVFVQKSVRYADVPRHLLQLGQITGTETGAKRTADAMNAAAAQVARAVAGKPRQTVFVEISASPLYAAGPGSFVDDLIRRAGGVNVVRGTNPFPAYSKEALLAADPAHYVVAQEGPLSRSAATLPPPLDRLRASRTGNVHRIPADLLLRPGPRLADGLARLAQALHPVKGTSAMRSGKNLCVGFAAMAALLLPVIASGVRACIPAHPVQTAQQITNDAEVIVRGKVLAYRKRAHEKDGNTYWGDVDFKVLEVLKGVSARDIITLSGQTEQYRGPNDKAPPYDFVRPGGGTGSCFAQDYKKNGQFLLFLKNGSVHRSPLAATNEEVTGPNDPWVRWVKEYLAASGAGADRRSTP